MSNDMQFHNGPAIILSGGTVSDVALSNKDSFNKYAVAYSMGLFNESWLELKRIFLNLGVTTGVGQDIKKPWKIDEKNKMVKIWARSIEKPAVLNSDGQRVSARDIRDGDFVRINVRPTIWTKDETVSYLNPATFEQVTDNTRKAGMSILLNGVKQYEQSDIFEEVEA